MGATATKSTSAGTKRYRTVDDQERSFTILPSTHDDVAQERLHRKQRLAATFRLFAKLDFDPLAIPGHVTVRDPQWSDHFWVNPLAVNFGLIRVSDLLLVNHKGEIVEGDRPVNRAAFAIHSAIHKRRPDVNAAAHTHATYGKAFSTLNKPLLPLTQDSTAFYEDHVVFDHYNGVVLSEEEGLGLADALGDKKAAILRNHGLLTVGPTVESAAFWYIAFENAARTQLLAQAAGTPQPLSHEVAKLTWGQVGTHAGAHYSFRPLWDRIVQEQPDLLD